MAETTTTTEPLSNAEILLPNGNVRAMGYIDKVWESGGKRYISIDYAQMLTGEEARQAAIDAGVIQPGDYLDNDYFIVNDNPRKREFTVTATATFATSTFGGGGLDQPTTWAQFKSFWSASPPAGGEHLHELPWWIERTGGEVVSIEEQYLPRSGRPLVRCARDRRSHIRDQARHSVRSTGIRLPMLEIP